MKYLIKAIFIFYLMIEISINRGLSYEALSLFLLIVAITIVKEKFYDSIYMTLAILLLVFIGAMLDQRIAVLLLLPFFDFVFTRIYYGIIPVFVALLYFYKEDQNLFLVLVTLVITGFLAHSIQKEELEKNHFRQTLDNERRLRYELEQTKVKLLHSSREIANIAEIKERNRIAREIHDSIGHSIAGILIQLQAAYKLHKKDEVKAMEIVNKSIDGLANAVQLLRDTVHNIKPRENIGIEYMKSVIENFRFCPIDFKVRGDFNAIPASHIEILTTNIKEALTNSSRYSQATQVQIVIDINEQYSRLFFKDNGIGCSKIKEGLGLSGMKERVRNMGGTISISGNEGFLIVCLIPRYEGSSLFEGINRG